METHMTRDKQTIVVTGANRGLGLEFVKQWAEVGNRVFALCRTPTESPSLRDVAESYPGRVTLHACDIQEEGSVKEVAGVVGSQIDRVDLLVNNAGIYGEGGGQGLDDVSLDDCLRVFDVNALGAIRMSRAFRGLLQRGIQPKVVHITSLMGCVEDNTGGGSWAYRLSKCALNMVSRNLAVELAPSSIPSVAIHPGWVRTDMGGESAPLGVEESVSLMIPTIDGLSMKQSGKVIDLRGNNLPF